MATTVTAAQALLLLSLSVLAISSKTDHDKPNIVFFLIDDLGWNDTGYQGAEFNTPTIDKLASDSIRLQQYYVQPLCSPSRAALMVGKYPYKLGLAHSVIINGIPLGLGLNETTLPQLLKKGGYTTHVVGKWDLGMHKWDYTPTYRGFDSFYGFYDAEEDHYTHKVGHQFQAGNFSGLDFRNNKDAIKDEDGTDGTFLFTDAIKKAITEHNSSAGPFFIYGAYQNVHSPLQVPDSYKDLCSHIKYPNRQIFCGMTKALDDGINNVSLLLEDKGYLDNTIIIFSTDNGGQTTEGSSNWPLRGNKATVFEGGVRGQGFIWGNKLEKKDYDYSGIMHLTDWLPTIVEGIAGIPLDTDQMSLDGTNMWDAITTNATSPRKDILIQLDPPNYNDPSQPFVGQAALRSGDWKLILGQPNCSLTEVVRGPECPDGWIHLNGTIEPPPPTPSLTWLFNLADDPNERNNVADDHPDVVAMLKQRIQEYNSTHVEQLDPRPDPNSNPNNFDGVWTPWL